MTDTNVQLSGGEQVMGILPVTNGGTGSSTLSGAGIATLTGTQTITNTRVQPRIVTVSSSATPTLNTDTADQANMLTLTANITSMTTNLTGTPVDGQLLMYRIKSASAQTITWGAKFISSGVATLLATTVAGKVHHVGLIWDSAASAWVALAVDATGY